jgi:hypothetical protein
VDRKATKKVCERAQERLITEKPLCGTDYTAAHGPIVFSKPLELLFTDYLKSSGGMLVYQAEHGNGKSFTVNALVRARLPASMQPERFLVVTPDNSGTVDGWYASVFGKLRVQGLTQTELVDALVKVFQNEAIKTDKAKLGLNVEVKDLEVALDSLSSVKNPFAC